jgi:hypothetical protein
VFDIERGIVGVAGTHTAFAKCHELPRRVGVDHAEAFARIGEGEKVVDRAAMLVELGVPLLGVPDLLSLDEALRNTVIGALARTFDLGFELVLRKRREFLPTRRLRLVDAEIGELWLVV